MCVALPGGNATLIFIFTEALRDNSHIDWACFKILKFSFDAISRPKGHKQQTKINMFMQIPLIFLLEASLGSKLNINIYQKKSILSSVHAKRT